jgi:hypothetical protein
MVWCYVHISYHTTQCFYSLLVGLFIGSPSPLDHRQFFLSLTLHCEKGCHAKKILQLTVTVNSASTARLSHKALLKGQSAKKPGTEKQNVKSKKE